MSTLYYIIRIIIHYSKHNPWAGREQGRQEGASRLTATIARISGRPRNCFDLLHRMVYLPICFIALTLAPAYFASMNRRVGWKASALWRSCVFLTVDLNINVNLVSLKFK